MLSLGCLACRNLLAPAQRGNISPREERKRERRGEARGKRERADKWSETRVGARGQRRGRERRGRYCIHYRVARPIGCLIFMGHLFPQRPIISGSLTERDMQLEAPYAFSPPCTASTNKIPWLLTLAFGQAQQGAHAVCVMLHTHMKESCHSYERVVCRIWMSHILHMNNARVYPLESTLTAEFACRVATTNRRRIFAGFFPQVSPEYSGWFAGRNLQRYDIHLRQLHSSTARCTAREIINPPPTEQGA